MNKLLLTASMGIFFLNFSTVDSAHAAITIEELLGQPDPLKTLTEMESGDHENYKSLCAQIKDPSFYDQATAAGMGPLKRSTLIRKCSGVTLATVKTKAPVQGAAAAVPERAVVQLRHVDLRETGTFEEREARFAQARAAMLEDAAQLKEQARGKDKEKLQAAIKAIEEKLSTATVEMGKSKDFYDNLSAAVLVLREDLREIRVRGFNLVEHEGDTPEAFIEALVAVAKPGIFDENSLSQIKAADALLKQAKENLEKARMEFVAINREMLELTQSEGGAPSESAAAAEGGK